MISFSVTAEFKAEVKKVVKTRWFRYETGKGVLKLPWRAECKTAGSDEDVSGRKKGIANKSILSRPYGAASEIPIHHWQKRRRFYPLPVTQDSTKTPSIPVAAVEVKDHAHYYARRRGYSTISLCQNTRLCTRMFHCKLSNSEHGLKRPSFRIVTSAEAWIAGTHMYSQPTLR